MNTSATRISRIYPLVAHRFRLLLCGSLMIWLASFTHESKGQRIPQYIQNEANRYRDISDSVYEGKPVFMDLNEGLTNGHIHYVSWEDAYYYYFRIADRMLPYSNSSTVREKLENFIDFDKYDLGFKSKMQLF